MGTTMVDGKHRSQRQLSSKGNGNRICFAMSRSYTCELAVCVHMYTVQYI